MTVDEIKAALMASKYHNCLTKRQIDIIAAVVVHRNLDAAGKSLFVHYKTVQFHLTQVYKKLKMHNRFDLYDLVSTLVTGYRISKAYLPIGKPSL